MAYRAEVKLDTFLKEMHAKYRQDEAVWSEAIIKTDKYRNNAKVGKNAKGEVLIVPISDAEHETYMDYVQNALSTYVFMKQEWDEVLKQLVPGEKPEDEQLRQALWLEYVAAKRDERNAKERKTDKIPYIIETPEDQKKYGTPPVTPPITIPPAKDYSRTNKSKAIG